MDGSSTLLITASVCYPAHVFALVLTDQKEFVPTSAIPVTDSLNDADTLVSIPLAFPQITKKLVCRCQNDLSCWPPSAPPDSGAKALPTPAKITATVVLRSHSHHATFQPCLCFRNPFD